MLHDAAIIETECSCPYDYGGICKHVVALLLAWCHMPEEFARIPSVEHLLEGYSRAELAKVLTAAIDRNPKLLGDLAPQHFTMPTFGEWGEDEFY